MLHSLVCGENNLSFVYIIYHPIGSSLQLQYISHSPEMGSSGWRAVRQHGVSSLLLTTAAYRTRHTVQDEKQSC